MVDYDAMQATKKSMEWSIQWLVDVNPTAICETSCYLIAYREKDWLPHIRPIGRGGGGLRGFK